MSIQILIRMTFCDCLIVYITKMLIEVLVAQQLRATIRGKVFLESIKP